MVTTRRHLNRSFRAACAKPGTLLFSFAAGALLRLSSTRGERPSKPATPDDGRSTGPIPAALAQFVVLVLQLSVRHLALRAGEAVVSGPPQSPEASEVIGGQE
jgi:hypothetical protein